MFKRILQQGSEGDALQSIALMKQGQIVNLDEPLALKAAKISLQHRRPMVDSIFLATARAHDATLWTQDLDFEGLDRTRYVAKA